MSNLDENQEGLVGAQNLEDAEDAGAPEVAEVADAPTDAPTDAGAFNSLTGEPEAE